MVTSITAVSQTAPRSEQGLASGTRRAAHHLVAALGSLLTALGDGPGVVSGDMGSSLLVRIGRDLYLEDGVAYRQGRR